MIGSIGQQRAKSSYCVAPTTSPSGSSHINRGTKTSLRFFRASLQHEHPRPQPQQLSVVRPLFPTFGVQDTLVDERPCAAKVSRQGKTFGLQGSQVADPDAVSGCGSRPIALSSCTMLSVARPVRSEMMPRLISAMFSPNSATP